MQLTQIYLHTTNIRELGTRQCIQNLCSPSVYLGDNRKGHLVRIPIVKVGFRFTLGIVNIN